MNSDRKSYRRVRRFERNRLCISVPPIRRNIPLRVIRSKFCLDNGRFDEKLPGSQTLTFSLSYDTFVLCVESFPFPCQEAILFIEFSSRVHSTGKSKSATRQKIPQYSGYPPPLHLKRPRGLHCDILVIRDHELHDLD
jgi:hypothetical protein